MHKCPEEGRKELYIQHHWSSMKKKKYECLTADTACQEEQKKKLISILLFTIQSNYVNKFITHNIFHWPVWGVSSSHHIWSKSIPSRLRPWWSDWISTSSPYSLLRRAIIQTTVDIWRSGQFGGTESDDGFSRVNNHVYISWNLPVTNRAPVLLALPRSFSAKQVYLPSSARVRLRISRLPSSQMNTLGGGKPEWILHTWVRNSCVI